MDGHSHGPEVECFHSLDDLGPNQQASRCPSQLRHSPVVYYTHAFNHNHSY